MKNLPLIVTMFVAAFGLSACGPDGQFPEIPTDGATIAIDASVTAFTRATDKAFEEGDAIGVYVLNPSLYVENGKFTLSEGKWTGDKEYKWYQPDTLQSAVVGYAPYKTGWQISDKATFSVAADQSTETAYKASDLLLAGVRALPSAAAVKLPFVHALSQIVIEVDNQTGGTITGIEIQNVATETTVNMIEQKIVATTGNAVTVVPARMQDATNPSAECYGAIVVPQTTALNIVVSVDSKPCEPFQAEITLESGKSYRSEIKLESTSSPATIDLSFTVSDWGDGDELLFYKYDDEGWIARGTAIYIDDIMVKMPRIGLSLPVEYEVELQEHFCRPGYYRIVNPYGQNWIEATGADDRIARQILDGTIVINATDPEKVYIERSWPGIHLEGIGTAMIETPCPENESDEKEYLPDQIPYGKLVDGVITFPKDGILVYFNTLTEKYSAGSTGRYSTLTLPGVTRTKRYFGINSLVFKDIENQDSDEPNATFHMTLNLDTENVRVGMFNGIFYSVEALEAKLAQLIDGTAQSQPLETSGGGRYEFSLPVPASGSYTVIAYHVGADGKPYYKSATFAYVASDFQAPPCELEIISASPTEINPESQIVTRIKCNDYESGYALAVPTATLAEANYSEADYALLAQQYGAEHDIIYSEYISSSAGCDFWISDLQPETDYTVIFYAQTNMKAAACKWATVTTGSAPTEADWKLLGEGTYYDGSQFFTEEFNADPYLSTVEIYQKADGSPRYRAMRPYVEYWANASDKVLEHYAGSSADYVDFYTKSYSDGNTYVYYAPYSTGYINPYGRYCTLYVTHLTAENIMPWVWAFTYNNTMIAKGVYHLAPLYYSYADNGGYPYYSHPKETSIVITLPGAAATTVQTAPPVGVAPCLTATELDGGNMIRVLGRLEPLDRNCNIPIAKPIVKKTGFNESK